MPETAIHERRHLPTRKDDVWTGPHRTRLDRMIDPVPESAGMKKPPDAKLGLRIRAAISLHGSGYRSATRLGITFVSRTGGIRGRTHSVLVGSKVLSIVPVGIVFNVLANRSAERFCYAGGNGVPDLDVLR
jgi:hypothetical protein